MKKVIQILQGFATVVKRFPLTMLCAAIAVTLSIYLIEVNYSSNEYMPFLLTILTSWLGLTLFFSIQMFCESRDVSKNNRIILYAGGVALLLLYRFLLVEQLREIEITRFVLFNLGLHLAASFAPFIGSKNTKAFWQYNEMLFIRFLTSALYSGVLFIGITIAIVATDQLFNVHIVGKIYGELWVFIAGIFNTAFFLSGVPAVDTLNESDKPYPKGLKIFTQFVLLPLVTLYLAILYLYLFKIIFKWSLPVGWVSYLIIAFSVCGIFSLLLIYPIRNNDENKWIKTFSNIFYIAIIPLIGLLFIAIFYRVFEYGITEHRYFVLILAFWLLGIAIYFLSVKSYNIKAIPVTLAVICFATSFGPWGAFYVSKVSQTNRLEKLLVQNGMLVGGKVKKSNGKITTKANYEITSVLNYLDDTHGFKHLQPWFDVKLDTLLKENTERYYYRNQSNDMHKLLGLTNVSYYNEDDTENTEQKSFNFSTKNQNIKSVSSYDYLLDHNYYDGNNSKDNNIYALDSSNTFKVEKLSRQLLAFKLNEKKIGTLNLRDVFNKLKPMAKVNQYGIDAYDLDPGQTTYYIGAGYKLRVSIVNMYGNFTKNKVEISSCSMQILVYTK